MISIRYTLLTIVFMFVISAFATGKAVAGDVDIGSANYYASKACKLVISGEPAENRREIFDSGKCFGVLEVIMSLNGSLYCKELTHKEILKKMEAYIEKFPQRGNDKVGLLAIKLLTLDYPCESFADKAMEMDKKYKPSTPNLE